MRFASGVEPVLREAGWTPSRHIDVDPWRKSYALTGCVMTDAADVFLSEFGGLRFIHGGPGINRSREPLDFDPSWCGGEEDRFIDWGSRLGRTLFPIGVLDGRWCLGIDEFSEIYMLETWVDTFGQMPDAMNGLILGKMPTDVTPQ